MDAKYKIGDKVWYASCKTIERTVLCPDCFGQRALTVIKGDGSQVSIECCGCARGFGNPTGYVGYYSHEVDVSEVTIDRVELTAMGAEYGFRGCYRAKEDGVFSTKEEAEKRAEELARKYNQEQLDQVFRKEKHNKTWAWNAHYHRDCIKRAERDLVYHTAKLNAAKSKVKEEKIESDEKKA